MACKPEENAEWEQAALLFKKPDERPERNGSVTTRGQRSSFTGLAYAAVAILLVLAAFYLGRLHRPSTAPSKDIPILQNLTQSSEGLTMDEERALNNRFGERNRVAAILQTVPPYLAQEIDAIWPELLAGSNPYFAALYLIERYSEAVLWSFFVELADTDGSGGYSYQERQAYMRRLRGKVEGHHLRLQKCSVGLVDCFGAIDYFEYTGDEQNLLEPHYLFEWIAFANTKCTRCLFDAALASGPPYNTAESERPKLDCLLGGVDQRWEETDFSWPVCSAELDDGISKDEMASGLIGKYAYSVIGQDGGGVLQLTVSAS